MTQALATLAAADYLSHKVVDDKQTSDDWGDKVNSSDKFPMKAAPIISSKLHLAGNEAVTQALISLCIRKECTHIWRPLGLNGWYGVCSSSA